jgi:1,4-alpha-glucan branching enzyme
MRIFHLILFFSCLIAEDINVRYIESPSEEFVRVFIPGEMNDWGPNSNGFISPNAESQLIYNNGTNSYNKFYSLNVGEQVLYKIHFHFNSTGTEYAWISDPLNPLTTSDGWDNSILNVTDPLFFQPARHMNEEGLVDGLSVGIFSTGTVNSVLYSVGSDTVYATEMYDAENGVFYASLDPPRTLFESYWVEALIDGEFYTVYHQPAIEISEEPLPAGVNLGPNWINNEMVLAVHAPAQPVMQVIVTTPGSTGETSDAMVMTKATDHEDVWWIQLDVPYGQYEYEYLLLNGDRIPDPLSRRLTNGKTRIEIGGGGISTADDYQWQSNDYNRPSLDTLIIYELHVDDFAAQGNGDGTFQDIINKLDYLKSTGINAIEMLPVTDFPGTHSWGYDPEIMSAVEGNYGTPEDLKQLVDEAHLRGIAIIGDLVWNHIRSSSPLWQIQPDYVLNPYIKLHTDLNPNETEGTWGMLDLDHFNTHTIDYVNEVHRIWIEEYRFDGFRYDATQYVGWDLNQPEFGLPAWTDALSELDPSAYQIAEHLPANPWLIDHTNLTSSWHDSFHDIVLEDAHDQYNSALTMMNQVIGLNEYSNSGDSYSDRTQAVKYMVSHDEQSIIQEMVEFGNSSLDQARSYDKFYAILLFTAQGIPMIFQGQEFGLQTGWTDENNNGDYEEKLQYRPVDWSVLNSDEGQSHLSHYSTLARLRKKNPAFSKGTFFDLWRYEAEQVIVYGYKDESEGNENDQVVVIANFADYTRTVNDVPFLSAGDWYNILEPGNDLYTSDGNYGEYSLPGHTAVIYTNHVYDLGTDDGVIPTNFQTIHAYPNPFNGHISIEINLATNLEGQLTIFDILGHEIKTLNISEFGNGSNRFEWDATTNQGDPISTGVYFIQLSTPAEIKTQKILYLK